MTGWVGLLLVVVRGLGEGGLLATGGCLLGLFRFLVIIIVGVVNCYCPTVIGRVDARVHVIAHDTMNYSMIDLQIFYFTSTEIIIEEIVSREPLKRHIIISENADRVLW